MAVRSLILACCLGVAGCIVPVHGDTDGGTVEDTASPDASSALACGEGAAPRHGDPCDPFALDPGKVCRFGSCLIGCATTCSCTNESRWSCASECREYTNLAFRYECGDSPACDRFCRAYPAADAGP